LAGCDTPTSESKTRYYYEFFRISKKYYNAISPPSITTFDSIKYYRSQLKSVSVELIGSGADATQSGIYELLISRGATPAEANQQILLLNMRGNNIAFFEYAYNPSYYIAAYVEKL
jgi:hypothetical protein